MHVDSLHGRMKFSDGVFWALHDGSVQISHADHLGDVYQLSAQSALQVLAKFFAGSSVAGISDSLSSHSRAQFEEVAHEWIRLGILVPESEYDMKSSTRSPSFELLRTIKSYIDIENNHPKFVARYRRVSSRTYTSLPVSFALVNAVDYVINSKIPGAIVECGVWRGGSMELVAESLLGASEIRPMFLFDTFSLQWGMPRPEDGVELLKNKLKSAPIGNPRRDPKDLTGVTAENVRDRLMGLGYPRESLYLVEGFVQDTLANNCPDEVAIARLDTDDYESTLHELNILYPRIAPGGVLIIDDYGKQSGASRAVDDYFSREGRKRPLLTRLDIQGALAIK